MSSLYILLFPLFSYLIYNKIKALQQSRKSNNPSKFRANLFFLSLTLLVGILIGIVIEYV
jgi:F0F1-type ATP synthase assembly protein I